LAFNLVAYGVYGDFVSRIVRFVSMGLFFLIFLMPRFYKRSALIILIALVINDLLLIFFETFIVQNLILFLRLCVYLLIARLVIPYLKRIKVQTIEVVVFVVILIMNLALLYYIKDSINIQENADLISDILLYSYGTAIIFSVSTAFSFYSRYVDKASIFFLMTLISLVMSDLTFYIGFYLDFSEFYYLDRAFNIIALGFLLHFLFLFKNKIAGNGYTNRAKDLN